MFQKTINIGLAFGVVGELIEFGPQRAESLIVNSSGVANTIGFAFTKSNVTNIASVGGTVGTGVVFAGILCNPKAGAGYGTTAGPLAATINIPDNSQAAFLTMGTVVVAVTGSANIGDQIQYSTATGALSAVAPGASATSGNTLIPSASVWRFPTTAAGLVAIRLTN